MFRLADLGLVSWPVRIGDAEFRATFRILDRAALRARQQQGLEGFLERLKEDGQPRRPEDVVALLDATHKREDADEAALLARVTDWRNVVDDAGNPVPFSTDHLSALLATEYAFKALLHALLEASREGPEKNSLPGPAGSPAPAQE